MRLNPWARRALGVVARFVVAGALLGVIVSRVSLVAVAAVARRVTPGLALAAVAVMALVGLVAAAKWWVLLRAQGVAVAVPTVARLTYIALTWNLALPGGESGNLVKAALLVRRQPDHAGRVWAATVVDQLSLGAAQLLVALATLALAQQPPAGRGIWLGAVGLGCGLIAALYAAFLAPVAPERVDAWVERLSRRLIIPRWVRRASHDAAATPVSDSPHAPGEWLAPLWGGLTRFRRQPGALLAALALAVGYYLVIFLAYWLAARGLGLLFSYPDIAWVTALAGVAALLPISVAGVGIREGIVLVFFTQRGVPPATALAFSLAVLALNVTLGLPGLALQLARPAAATTLRA